MKLVDARPFRRPLIVLEGPEGSSSRDAAVLRGAGLVLHVGFRAGDPARRRSVCHGIVATEEDAAAAVLAALAGHGLLVEAVAARETIDRLVEDLRHIGPVDHRQVEPPGPDPALDREGRVILALLAQGLTLRQAARELGIARRTADRRLAAARRVLAAERTSEAIAKASRLGWLD